VLKLAAGVGGDFGANVEVAGLYDIQMSDGKFQAAVVVPATQQAAKDPSWGGHRGVEFTLAKGGGGIELEGEFAGLVGGLFIELLIVAEVGPGLGALGGAQDAGDVQVGRPQVPGLVGD
jgi:hypothetical protein